MDKHTCPGCKGGKINVTVHSMGQMTSVELDCIWCNGAGKVTDSRLQAYYDHKNMWCECKGDDLDIQYYADGEHPSLSKHHYRHRKCGKVVQIG